MQLPGTLLTGTASIPTSLRLSPREQRERERRRDELEARIRTEEEERRRKELEAQLERRSSVGYYLLFFAMVIPAQLVLDVKEGLHRVGDAPLLFELHRPGRARFAGAEPAQLCLARLRQPGRDLVLFRRAR